MDGTSGVAYPRPIIKIQRASELTMHNVKHGDRVEFKGQQYFVARKSNDRFVLVEQTQNKPGNFFASFFNKVGTGLRDRLSDFSLRSRQARLEEKLLPATKKHLRVDVDKTLLYRGDLPKGKNSNDFEVVTILHKKYGHTRVYINKKMVTYLKEQQAAGAKISITSTGGWADESKADSDKAANVEKTKQSHLRMMDEPKSLITYLKEAGIQLVDFDNKATLEKKDWLGKFVFKSSVVGATDKTDAKRYNVMIDDKWFQLWGFDFKLEARLFGMG